MKTFPIFTDIHGRPGFTASLCKFFSVSLKSVKSISEIMILPVIDKKYRPKAKKGFEIMGYSFHKLNGEPPFDKNNLELA